MQLKFTLETYEGLGILRTLNSKKGEVVILAIDDTIESLKELLENLKKELDFREIEQPKDLDGDWLTKIINEQISG